MTATDTETTTARYEVLSCQVGSRADTFADAAAMIHTSTLRERWLVRDRLTGAIYDPRLAPAPLRVPRAGEQWLHRTLGEVEVIEEAVYQPQGKAWLVVRATDALRRMVDPDDLIGRAE